MPSILTPVSRGSEETAHVVAPFQLAANTSSYCQQQVNKYMVQLLTAIFITYADMVWPVREFFKILQQAKGIFAILHPDIYAPG